MSTESDVRFYEGDDTVYFDLIPKLFVEWQGIRLVQLSTGAPPLFGYNGTNLHHALRLVGASMDLARAVSWSLSVGAPYVESPDSVWITIDWPEDVIRCSRLFYHDHKSNGVIRDTIPFKALKIGCVETSRG